MNIAHWIEQWAIAAPQKTAIRFEGRDISYADFNDQIKASARVLKNDLGVAPGERIAYLGQNDPQMLALAFAAARLGALFVPLNWRLAPREHLHMLRDSGAAILFIDERYCEQCADFEAELPDCRLVAVGDTKRNWPSLATLLQDAKGSDCNPGIGLSEHFLIIYTSGTTGLPKGAVLSQEAVQYNALNSVIMHDMSSSDRILTFLPLFHVGGLNAQTTAGFYAGATIVLHRVFDPELVLDSIIDDKPTLTIVLPAHMPALRAVSGWETTDFSSLRCVLTGSTTIPQQMIRYWHDRGIPLVQMYGASETCPIAIHQMVGNAYTTAGSMGFPAMHCDIRVVDEAGNDLAPDEPGELMIRGKNVMAAYWNNEQATKKSLVDGWFYSGDIAYVDDAGCYHFVDRKKDVIISGGENIYPAEIEQVLIDHPDIAEAAVVGRKDPRWGEVPIAVVANTGNRDMEKEQVIDWFDGKLAKYKHPRDVLFVDALPRNEMRKVMKNNLREMVNRNANQ